MALKARFCPLAKSQKDPEKRSLEKRVIEPLIYEYLLM